MTALGTDSIAGAAMEYKVAMRTRIERNVISRCSDDAESPDTLTDCTSGRVAWGILSLCVAVK